MEYELCKKLRDAGFPQSKKLSYSFVKEDGFETEFNEDGLHYKVPTLSELIKACGVRMIIKNPIDVIPKGNPLITSNEPVNMAYTPRLFLYQDENHKWSAFDGTPYSDGFIELPQIESYLTPEEAVANLWLKLNKK